MSSKKDIYLVKGKMYIKADGKLNKNTGMKDDGVHQSFECVMIANEGESRQVILKRNKDRFLQEANKKYSSKVLTKAINEGNLKVAELVLVVKIGRTVYELD